MIGHSYDMTVSDAEFVSANQWWRNLLINQMKELEAKHFPSWRSGTHKRMIHQMWEEEGKPEPQAVIPVVPQPDTHLTVDMIRPLDPVENWMVKQNLEHAKTEGLDVVINRLKAQGYLRVAAAVEEQFQTPT